VESNAGYQGTIGSNNCLGSLGRGGWWKRGEVVRKGKENNSGNGMGFLEV